jgi:hypothetical protein
LSQDFQSPNRMVELLRHRLPVVLCAVTGFLCAFTVSLVGLLPIGELILLVLFPWVLIRVYSLKSWPGRIQQLGWYKLLLIAIGVMALGYIVSDLYRGTPGSNLARGWARVAFLGIDLVSVAYLIDQSWGRLQIFLFALYIGSTINAVFTGPLYGLWWEFGVGPTLAATALFLCAGRSTLVQIAVAMAFGVLSIAFGARSLGGICFLTAVLFGVRYARGIMRPLVFIAGLSAMVVLIFAAHAAIFDNPDKTQSNVERTSMIETAASEFIESPIIGQGSWYTASRMLRHLEERRASLDPNFHGYSEDEARMLSIHSQILITLAEGGILGGAFFIFYGGLLLKTLRTLLRLAVPHRAFVTYVVIDGIWNLCMSPFSGVTRTAIVLAVCTCLLVILQRRGELSENFRE